MKILMILMMFSVAALYGMESHDESCREFFELVKSRAYEEVEEILNKDISWLYKTSAQGEMPIHIAAGSILEMVAVMVRKDKSLVHSRDKNNRTPLHEATKNTEYIVEYFLNNGADIEAVDNNGNTPIMDALRNNVGVQKLLDRKARLDRKANNGWTVLHCATASGKTTLMDTIYEYNSNLLDVGDNDNTVPLHIAVSRGHLEAVKWLLEKKANVNMRELKGTLAVHIAILRRNLDITNLLLQHGAELPASIKEQVPNMGDDNTYKKLIENIANDGCDLHEWWVVNRKAFLNQSIRHLVEPVYNKQRLTIKIAKNDLKGVRSLIKKDGTLISPAGIFITARYKEVTQAIKDDNVEELKKLQAAGIPLWLKDKRGNTPLHAALWSGKTKTAEWLLENPETAMDIEEKNDQNKTPVMLAVNNVQSIEVIQKKYRQRLVI